MVPCSEMRSFNYYYVTMVQNRKLLINGNKLLSKRWSCFAVHGLLMAYSEVRSKLIVYAHLILERVQNEIRKYKS